jgi:hypothetical protein
MIFAAMHCPFGNDTQCISTVRGSLIQPAAEVHPILGLPYSSFSALMAGGACTVRVPTIQPSLRGFSLLDFVSYFPAQ